MRRFLAEELDLAVPFRVDKKGLLYVHRRWLALHLFDARLMVRPFRVWVRLTGFTFLKDDLIEWRRTTTL